MNTWFPYVRILHIACGMIALFVAPAAMLTLKGGLVHRRWGKIYFWTMAVVATTAMIMAVYRPIVFLALLAIFSFYFAFRVTEAFCESARVLRLWIGSARC